MADSTTRVVKDELKSTRLSPTSGDIIHIISVDEAGNVVSSTTSTSVGNTTPTTVGTSSITLIAANSTRKSAIVENTDAAKDLYISLSSPALNTHHHLNPGDIFSIDGYTGAIYAIASDVGTTVCWSEVG